MINFKILKYGLFDSKKEFNNQTHSPLRDVLCFEFDYILSCDKNSISYIDDKKCALFPNMLVIRKPFQKSHSRLHFKCYCLHLSIEKTNPMYNELLSLPEYYTLINDKTYQPLFESLFRHLIKLTDLKNDYFSSAKILELIYHLKKDEKSNKIIRHLSFRKENQSIQKAISFIKQNFKRAINLKQLGIITGYSPNHFLRIFTDVVGCSPQKYLEKTRIEHAKYLLSKNESNLTDIAYECGFSSQSYFCKTFKKYTLLSPSAFRQKSIFKFNEIEI